MLQVYQLNRRFSLLIVAGLLLVVVAASLAVLHENALLAPQGSRILWQRNIENFASGLAAADGKVYTIDIWGNICCYEDETGESVWNGSIGAYWGKGVTASSSMVYGGKASGEIGALDATTGEFQWSVHTASSSLYSKKAPDNITIVDGRVFVTTNSFSALNATTGELLWQITEFWVRGSSLKDNRVYVTTGGLSGVYIYRLNPDDGTTLWRINGTFSGHPVSYQGQVIMHNQTEIFSLDETTGASLWSYNVGATIYQPTAYNGLLVFEASNGNIYAIHLSDGSLAWKTHVDSQNITALANSDNPLKGLQIQIDTQNQRAIGGFAVTTQLAAFVQNGSDEYSGFLCSLDIDDGSIVWTKQFSANGDVSHENARFNFALNENNIYLTTEFDDFWIFSKSTGNIIESQHFEHYVSSPVAADNRVFVAADLWLIAYE
jgi:outer membrane protein assembly factor BamB